MTIGKVGKMLIPRLFFIVYFIYTLYITVCYYMDCLLQLLSPNAVSPLLAPENSRPLLRWPAYIATAHHAYCPCRLIQRFLSPSAFQSLAYCLTNCRLDVDS